MWIEKNERILSAPKPSFAASNIHYEVSEQIRAIGAGGLGAVHRMARQVGLIKEIDEHLHVLQFHSPYHESDHSLTIGYNVLVGNTRLEQINELREDDAALDALGTKTMPHSSTAGDFTRRLCRTLRDIVKCCG